MLNALPRTTLCIYQAWDGHALVCALLKLHLSFVFLLNSICPSIPTYFFTLVVYFCVFCLFICFCASVCLLNHFYFFSSF